jgi:hypothetical protein
MNARKKKQSRTNLITGKKETYYTRGKEIDIKKGFRTKALALKRLSKPVNAYNQVWSKHSLTLHDKALAPFCARVFTAQIYLGGRFYGDIQNIPKAERQLLKIDDQETIEPDFKAYHLCILYAWAGYQLNPEINNPYEIEGFERNTVKLAMLSFINPETKAIYQNYIREKNVFILRSSQGLEAKEPFKPPSIRGFIEGMPDGINGGELVASLLKTHHKIAGYFETADIENADIGLRLQFFDSEIMAEILTILSKNNIPVIPVHDSVRCKVDDLDFVTETMKTAYFNKTNFNGCITI